MTLAVLTVMAMLTALGFAARTAWATDDITAHKEQDTVMPLDSATEKRMVQQSVVRSAADVQTAAAAVVGDPGQVGQWGPLENWPVVAISAALMPNGKVLAFDAVGDLSYTKYPDQSFTRATVWDPVTDTHTPDWEQLGYNVFCSGLDFLMDGTLFMAGGNADQVSSGLQNTTYFDYRTNAWSAGALMQFPRWYPTVTRLANGEMLITGGRPWLPEVRQLDGSIRALSEQTGTMEVPLYPWMDVAPDGRVFYSGPDDNLRKLDPTGPGAWQSYGARDGIDRNYGSHAMYDIGKMLIAGGGPATNTALTIDINGSTPQVTPTDSMAFGRRQFNLTMLPDGKVLATGGLYTGDYYYVNVNGGVYNPEVWDPATGHWTTLAPESFTRQYHSTALLLPDGRVLSAGGGICNDCDDQGYLGKNAQIFSPPYLFKHDGSGEPAPRPTISSAPDQIGYGSSFPITTPDAASIDKVALIKLGAVTHDVNMGQRYVPLSFTKGNGQLTATDPANVNIAPPGFYMLWIVDSAGVPSVAKILQVSASAPPPPPPNQPPTVTLTQPADGATYTAPATVDLAATASDDGTVAKVEFFNGTTKLGEDTTAPYTYSWNGVDAGTYTLTAKATDDVGATTTSAASKITVNATPPPNQPPTVTLTQPANGATYTAPATVGLAATASDDGSVAKVEFFNGTTKLGEDTTAPYGYTWSGVGAGTYTLTAKATDDLGATTTSGASTITVNPAPPANKPPTASITSPADGAVFPYKPTITITATASDPDGRVTKVDFYDGATLLGSDTTAPYSRTWKNVPQGGHTLRVRATDNAGAVTTSAPVSITVVRRVATAARHHRSHPKKAKWWRITLRKHGTIIVLRAR